MGDEKGIHSLLDKRPELESAVESVLEVDPPWTFDDIDVDSGAFGELVAHGVVERNGDGYRVADPAAVQAALNGRDGDAVGGEGKDSPAFGCSIPSRMDAAAVGGGLLLVALLRVTSVADVFRGDDVVLTANDPYYYLYLVRESLASGGSGLASLPPGPLQGEPLLVATLRAATELAGGTPSAAGLVLAWYPVVAAVVTGGLVYALVTVLTDDRRVALASLAMFALTPGHAFRTSLGFADHHAFDYAWLVLTALAVTVLVAETTRRDTPRPDRTALGVLGVAAGVAGQTLAWEAGPLLLLPLGAYLAIDGLLAVHTDRSPTRTHAPTLLGVGGGAVVAWAVHATLGWHRPFVAASPALLFAGGVGVVAVAEASHRLDLRTAIPAAAAFAAGVGVVVAVSVQFPGRWEQFVTSVQTRLFRTGAIAETIGLFGESFGWLLLFGFVLLLAVPYLLVTTRRIAERPVWTPLVVYTWYFVAFAVAQVRFVGQMALFTAVFAGVGFVALAAWVDAVDEPPALTGEVPESVRSLRVPDRTTAQSLLVLFFLVGSLSFVQIPVKTGQLTHTDAQYETASWMGDLAEERKLKYPNSYVLSQWGENRFYNYFVSGQSRSDGFARSNYVPFLLGTDPGRWYERLHERTGFVVVSPAAVGNDTTMGTRLYRADGSRTEATAGLAHYRLVFVSENTQYKVFTLVPGARLVGRASPNRTITVSTDVTAGSYTTTYERRVAVGPDGNYSVTVPYASEYRVAGESAAVNETAVRNGTTVVVG